MICQNCQDREANIHLTKIINGQAEVMHLCQECAQKIQGFGFGMHPEMVSDFLQALFEAGSNKQVKAQQDENIKKCPLCGMTLAQIQQAGKLGCSECYETFESELEILLRKIHGKGLHVGKIPAQGWTELKSKHELEHLKQKLQGFIQKEQFEEAAVMRDRIKELEKSAGGEQNEQ